MKAFLYGIFLQFRLDIRSKTMLVTCYLVPLIFYAVMGSIFTSLIPDIQSTLIQSMTIMGVSMGALIGVPPTIAEIYGTDIKKMYMANHVLLSFGILSLGFSSLIHLMISSSIILFTAPSIFEAALPSNIGIYYGQLALFILASLTVACALGLFVNNQAKLTMFSQLVFLPSILLSGIMFPSELLYAPLQALGKLFPAYWAYQLLTHPFIEYQSIFYLLLCVLLMSGLCAMLLRKMKAA